MLFIDAMTVRRRGLRTDGFLPARLLCVGPPLSIGAGWLLAWPLLPGLTLWELALVGAVLAPTDAALGKTAMSSPRVPAPVRHGLNVESGLNDGGVGATVRPGWRHGRVRTGARGDGSGFIGAWIGGFAFGSALRRIAATQSRFPTLGRRFPTVESRLPDTDPQGAPAPRRTPPTPPPVSPGTSANSSPHSACWSSAPYCSARHWST
ncbi:hypothetical protein GTY41_17445 [Streptomyces sp. SID685]|uniref:hypothetical protein n=1 Tax=Streptomyces sp. SID685 TaxID=2690322 RepID=UPI00136E9DD2|nr:hypothetical protein [Streptomyces sp. SID685]MYR86675.1 hypothetical protein [Streptomyces sp. SID685]